MKKIHAVAIALILAVSAGLGLVAATRTAGLRTTTGTSAAPSASLAARAHRLSRIEASLRRALRDKPPALPAVPAAGRPAAAPAQQRVIYRRPAPIVVVKHRLNHESEHEHESEGSGDD